MSYPSLTMEGVYSTNIELGYGAGIRHAVLNFSFEGQRVQHLIDRCLDSDSIAHRIC